MVENLSVRELMQDDIPLLADYWLTASDEHLMRLGADRAKLPSRENFVKMLEAQLALPYQGKNAYALIWEEAGRPIGHCNINPIAYGDYAYMHLHKWDNDGRQRGAGTALVKMSLPYFFKNFNLKTLYCQPHAENDAPNRTLEKSGFIFVKQYTTTPGAITFEQPVKLWEMPRPENI